MWLEERAWSAHLPEEREPTEVKYILKFPCRYPFLLSRGNGELSVSYFEAFSGERKQHLLATSASVCGGGGKRGRVIES